MENVNDPNLNNIKNVFNTKLEQIHNLFTKNKNHLLKFIIELYLSNILPKPIYFGFIFTFISAIISTLYIILLILSYNFLYGFYFSGRTNTSPSYIDILIDPVPFNVYSLLLVSSFFTTSIILIALGISIYRKRDYKKIFKLFYLAFLFYITYTMFFISSEEDLLSKFFSGFLFWIVTIVFTILLLFFNKLIKAPLFTIIGMFYGIFIAMFIEKLNIISVNSFIQILIILFGFLASWIEKFLFKNKLGTFFGHLLIIGLVILIGFYYLKANHLNNWYMLFIPLIIGVILSIMILHLYKKLLIYLERERNDLTTNTHQKSVRQTIIIFSLMSLLFINFAPQVSFITGQFIRNLLPCQSMEIISYKDSSIQGKVVSNNNGVFYISDLDYQLHIINNDEIHISFSGYLCN